MALLLLGGLVLPDPALARPATAPVADPAAGALARSAALSGSPRLLLFALTDGRRPGDPPPDPRLVAGLAQTLGFAHPAGRGPALLARGMTVAPVLEWDANVNGGIPGGTFNIGPFAFTVDEGSEARAGVMVGASVGATAALSVGRGQVLRFSARAAVRHAPDHGATKIDLGLTACGSFHTGGWGWVDACLGAVQSRNDTGTEVERTASLSRVVVFPSAAGVHEGSVGLRVAALDGGDVKPSLTMGLVTATGDGAIVLSLEGGPEVEGRNTTLFRANVALTRPVLGRVTTLSAGFRRTGGASFFGQARTDDIWSVGVSRQIGGRGGQAGVLRGLSARVEVRHTRSTVDLFDGTTVFLGVDLGQMQF
ncbi:MAG: hypothetical protein MUF73_06625 [Rhodobacteraceae bacterium]|nr:hypothetical protein [Paracoccaceae bacterium]